MKCRRYDRKIRSFHRYVRICECSVLRGLRHEPERYKAHRVYRPAIGENLGLLYPTLARIPKPADFARSHGFRRGNSPA